MDQLIKVVDAVTRLAAALVWPGVAIFLLLRFGPGLKDFMNNLGELSLKGLGFEASAKREQAVAAAALTAAAVSHPQEGTTPRSTANEAWAAFDLVSEVATPKVIRNAQGSTVLWVDDRPDNNVHEREAMEALRVRFVLAQSTDEALGLLKGQSFDAIISDMGRPPDPQAGYTLLDKLRKMGNENPIRHLCRLACSRA